METQSSGHLFQWRWSAGSFYHKGKMKAVSMRPASVTHTLYKVPVPYVCEVSIRAVLFQDNNFKYLSQGQEPPASGRGRISSSPKHRRRDQARGGMNQKASEASVGISKTIFSFHPKIRVQCSRRPALYAPSAIPHPSATDFLADFLWCGFECPPAEEGQKPWCLISWTHVQTTNLKPRHYHQCF